MFGIFTVLLFTHSGIPHPTTANLHGGFSEGLFLGGIRLLSSTPPDTRPTWPTTRATPRHVAGQGDRVVVVFRDRAVRVRWSSILGAYLTSITCFALNTLGAVVTVSNSLQPGVHLRFAIIVICILALQGSLSMYAGGNTGISIVTSLQRRPRPVRPGVRARVAA